MKSQRAYVEHVVDCIRRIAEDSALGRDAVFASRTLQDAIAGMRNALVHDYFEVDFETVWLVVARDLPPLETAMRAILVALDQLG